MVSVVNVWFSVQQPVAVVPFMKKKPKVKGYAPVHSGQTVAEAFGAILLHNLEHLLAWEDAARSWDDIEGVHQARVALRRLRSALRVFRAAVPRSATDSWSAEMRWLAEQLGPARDMDVFIDEGLEAVAGRLPLPGGDRLLVLARRRREDAYRIAQAMLSGERYGAFKERFRVWLQNRSWLEAEPSERRRRRLESDIATFARQALDKQDRRVLTTGAHVERESAQAMHQLRIECKKLRYAAEFFTPLFKGMDEFIGHLKALQDLLGIMHDVAVMHHLLDDLLAGEHDPAALQYAGALIGWRTRQSYDIEDSFDDRWDQFAAARRPWWRHANEEPAAEA